MYVDVKNLALDLVYALQGLQVARRLPSPSSRQNLMLDLSHYMSVVSSRNFEVRSIFPLLMKVVNNAPDADIWHAVIDIVTPPSSKHVRLYSTTSSVYRELQKGWNADDFPDS